MKNIRTLCEKFQFFEVKFSIYLNRRVFLMFLSAYKFLPIALENKYLRKCSYSTNDHDRKDFPKLAHFAS